MDAHTSPWLGRRVLVADCTGPLGSAVARALLDRGAVLAGVVSDGHPAAALTRDRDAGRFFPVRGRPDAGRLRTVLAVHEASVVFDPADTATVSRAVSGSGVALVVARPAGELRLAGTTPDAARSVARFGDVFGPADRRPDTPFARAAVGMPGDGPSRDYVFAADSARACLALAEAALAGETHDVTFRSGWAFTDRELARLVAAASAGERPDTPPCPTDNLFGWRPETPLAAALAESVAWHRQHLREPPADRRAARRAA